MRWFLSSLFTFGFLTSAHLSLAEEPVVVVYSDPSLTRLEKEIGVTPAQKDRFDDIVVKYRDPQESNEAEARNSGDANSGENVQSGRRGGGGEGGHSGGGRGSVFAGAKGSDLRQELKELATILTPDQLKKFKDLSQHKKKPPHHSS